MLARPTCTLAANIFDPLSASIAHMLEYEVCVLSGSVGKVANLGVPDGVLSNMSDVVDHCRRITRIADGDGDRARRAMEDPLLESGRAAAAELDARGFFDADAPGSR